MKRMSEPFTPAQYLAAMNAIGWRAVASCHDGVPVHVIEYAPEGHSNISDFWAIQQRIDNSSGEFWKRTSRFLYDQGLREEMIKRSAMPLVAAI
jgi:hypothetical protein